jgi:hypothetical protein
VEEGVGLLVAVMMIVCSVRVVDNNGTGPRGREGGRLKELEVVSRTAAEETSSHRNPRAFIRLACRDIIYQGAADTSTSFQRRPNHCYLIAMRSTRRDVARAAIEATGIIAFHGCGCARVDARG